MRKTRKMAGMLRLSRKALGRLGQAGDAFGMSVRGLSTNSELKEALLEKIPAQQVRAVVWVSQSLVGTEAWRSPVATGSISLGNPARRWLLGRGMVL